jgi:hypothetical protein
MSSAKAALATGFKPIARFAGCSPRSTQNFAVTIWRFYPPALCCHSFALELQEEMPTKTVLHPRHRSNYSTNASLGYLNFDAALAAIHAKFANSPPTGAAGHEAADLRLFNSASPR